MKPIKGKFIIENYSEAINLFRQYVETGYAGLIVTRHYAEAFSDLRCTAVWLSEEEGKNTIDPQNLPKLTHTVIDFMNENARAIVLLEGFEYLMVQNTFQILIKHLYMINDSVPVNNSIFLLTLAPQALEKQQMSILYREFTPF